MTMTASDEELAGAWQAYHTGDGGGAYAVCERLLSGDERNVGALFLASLIDHERGKQRAAIERLTRVVQLRPRYAEAHNNLGNAFAADGQLASAERSFREALRWKPPYAEALNNLGNALRDQRKLDEAIEQYHRALELRPEYAECHNNLGIALARKKRFDEAIVSYRRALVLNPTFAEPQNNLGIALAAQGRLEEATEAFRWAIDLKPSYVDALANLALALVDLGRFDEAVSAYRRAIARAPRAARLHNGLGIALTRYAVLPTTVVEGQGGQSPFGPRKDVLSSERRQPDLGDAAAAFRSAIEFDPGFYEAHNNLGNALRELGRLEEAEEHLCRALSLKSDYAEAHNNLGVVMVKRRRIAEGVASYNRALRLKPDYAEAHLNRALAWLASGDFRQGWMEYEWRWRCPGFKEVRSPRPRWDGGLADGKTILLWAEQGLGDTFQFVRYARLVRQRGARVLLRAPPSLHPILSRTPGVDRIVGEEEERFDCHAPLASLPRLFATTLDDVPGAEPYLFPDERLVADWKTRIGGIAPPESTFTIGVAWQGNPGFAADRQRSIPLGSLLPLANIPGVRLLSLQKGPGSEQLEAAVPDAASSAIVDFRPDLDAAHGAFMDTAAIMASLDLVLTSDTAVAHLAGGMGVPVGVLLPHAADWRWLTEGELSPWYPTMRLFRQTAAADWDVVVGRVADCVRRLVERRVPGQAIDRYPRVARALVDRGVQHAEAGQLEEAVALFRRALRYEPDLPEAYNNLGNALRGLGRLDEAMANLERAIGLAPDYAEARHNLGIVLSRLRRQEEAIARFQEAIERKPDFALAWTSLGLSQADLRRFADAEASFRRALELEPRSPRILNNLGNVLSDQGRRQDAVDELRRALEIDPRCVDAHNNLGNALRELGKHDEAIASFERAIAIRPEFPEAHNNLGIAWAGKGDYERAVACYREALRIWPEYPAAHNNLGIALGHQKQFADSIASYRRALELKPDYAEAYNNLGIALSQDGEHDEAVTCFRRAIELKPEYAEAFSNLGITLTEIGKLEEALASYNEALRLKPNYPDAYMNRALAFLVRGDFERGWHEYESRWQCKDFKPRNFKRPQWNGEPLEGRRILLHSEQGFGDTFQFVRYARLVKEERGGRVIVWCPKPLVPLVSQCPYVEEVTIEGDKLPEFDCHLPLLSLPKIFGTTPDSVPREMPYLFAEPELVKRWRDEFSYIDAFKIGINWQGNPRYRGDRHRSIPLEQFAPLASIPGVRLISLQKGLGTEQIGKVCEKLSLTELGAHRDEGAGAFMDTAAILKNVDLVVSSDTSLVHLAGGLGVPIWVALPWAADWRWLLNRDDSPWYPTMRLFRQRQVGNWEEVFQSISDEVRKLVKGRQSCECLTTPLLPEDLLDRIALLQVRLDTNCGGRASSRLELELARLSAACCRNLPESEQLSELRRELAAIHRALCNTEQAARGLPYECGRGELEPFLKSLRESQERRQTIKKQIGNLLNGDGSVLHL